MWGKYIKFAVSIITVQPPLLFVRRGLKICKLKKALGLTNIQYFTKIKKKVILYYFKKCSVAENLGSPIIGIFQRPWLVNYLSDNISSFFHSLKTWFKFGVATQDSLFYPPSNIQESFKLLWHNKGGWSGHFPTLN